jgi:hypothetical protein
VSRRRTAAIIACGVVLVALTLIGLWFQLEDRLDRFLIVGAAQSGVYAAAAWLAWNGGASRRAVLAIAALAIVMRLPVMLAPPYLSADIYRYVWDGRVEAAGFNPYLHTPADPQLEALRDQDIYPRIASPYAPTIYPPVAEAVFLVVARLSPSVTAMKIAMVLFDLLALVILARLLAVEGLPAGRLLVYAWHPLPLWEFAGSGHIDAMLIAGVLAALWAARERRTGLTGLFLAMATLTKFYPMILTPALYRRWDWKVPAVFAAAIVVAYLPFLSAGSQLLGFLPGYARQEGFDAGGAGFYLLGLLRRLPGLEGVSTGGYEFVAIALLGALGVALVLRRDRDRPPYATAAILAALFMVLVSPHYPWYFSWLIVFACFVRSCALPWLTTACLLLYLATDYVFVPSGQMLAIESLIYGPFAALAFVDFWYSRRRASLRS